MREHEGLTEMLEHSLAIVLFAKLHRRESHERANVAPKALRRRVVEMIGDVRDRKARILE